MRAFAVIAALIATSSATMKSGQNLNSYLQSCAKDATGSYSACSSKKVANAQCCAFDNGKTQTKFCLTDTMRANSMEGNYFDVNKDEWDWSCYGSGSDSDSSTTTPTKHE